jgi:hypothetical protein
MTHFHLIKLIKKFKIYKGMNVRNLEGSQKLSLGREVLGRNKEDHESLNSYHLQSQCLSCGLEGQEAEEVPYG